MRRKDLIVRLQDNVWGFRSEEAARKRYKELMRIVAHPSADKLNPSLKETLSGLMAPAAVATV